MADTFTKVDPSDEGPLQIKCYVKGDQVFMDFGKDLSWFSMGIEEAQQVVDVLGEKIAELKKLNG